MLGCRALNGNGRHVKARRAKVPVALHYSNEAPLNCRPRASLCAFPTRPVVRDLAAI
jgi:hypothetical protein